MLARRMAASIALITALGGVATVSAGAGTGPVRVIVVPHPAAAPAALMNPP